MREALGTIECRMMAVVATGFEARAAGGAPTAGAANATMQKDSNLAAASKRRSRG
jgi:hypothetical protein